MYFSVLELVSFSYLLCHIALTLAVVQLKMLIIVYLVINIAETSCRIKTMKIYPF